MTALPCKGVTGNGLLHPDELTGWAGVAVAFPGDTADVPDGAGVAEPTGPAWLAAGAGRAGAVIPAA